MQEYDNNNSGVLFKNDKGDNEARPDYTGNVKADGKDYRLAAWIRESKTTGKKFLSLRLQPAEEKSTADGDPKDEAVADEIPFNEVP